MEAVNCTCGVPVDIGKCTQPIPQGVACILYDDKVTLKTTGAAWPIIAIHHHPPVPDHQ